ncbi:MAG TPA: DoxX family protein [Candidatus Saccharimonadales bacterium]|nr:DoxX family protein [Candidatus Saccharimonadales bacterium]
MAIDTGLLILRLVVGLIFAAHGAQKMLGWWGGPGLAGWRGAMERMGLRPAAVWAVISALAELAGGLLFALGLLTPLVVAVLIAQSIVIVGKVHLPRGFWNAKGGVEFPLSLAAGIVAIALTGPGADSLDRALNLRYSTSLQIAVITLGILGGLGTIALPRLIPTRRTTAPQPR